MSLYNEDVPYNFESIIGNNAAVKILLSLLKLNYIPNGIIFSGIHGIGKTLLANLFAKAINCLGDNKPCNRCANCLNTCNDIIEVDAATYTGIDNMRQILESTNYLPLNLKIKVFIIDEVHMLSKNAFDALLMTLHNPPYYVRFLFATTEFHKLPSTFVSRCLHIPLIPLSYKEMLEVLKKKTNNISQKLLDQIIMYSEGSIRQALTFLEIALLVDENTCLEYFKMVNPNEVKNIFELILQGKLKPAMNIWQSLYEKGYDEKRFLHSLSALLEDITFHKINNQPHYFLDNYYMSYNLLINFWDIIHKNLEYLYANIPNVISKTLVMLSTTVEVSDLSHNIKQIFNS